MQKSIRVAIYLNNELKGVKELPLPFVIGRSSDVGLTVPHPMVSRRHCSIFEDHGIVRLRDLGSLNGTVVNDKNISEIEVKENTTFNIGNIRFVLSFQQENADRYVEFDSDSVILKAASMIVGKSASSDDVAKTVIPNDIVINKPITLKSPKPPFVISISDSNDINGLCDVPDLNKVDPHDDEN